MTFDSYEHLSDKPCVRLIEFGELVNLLARDVELTADRIEEILIRCSKTHDDLAAVIEEVRRCWATGPTPAKPVE